MLIERAFVSLVKTYGRQEAADKKLQVGLGNVADTTTGVTQRLIDYSSALQKTTAFGDEMITTGMVQLTTFGLNEEAIKALTPQVLNVARAIQTTSGSMPDLNSLFIAFGKATSTGIGTLTRYGVVLTEVERAQLENMDASESAVKIGEILERQYGGLADAYAKTTSGMLEAAAAARGDAAEAFGKALAPAVLGVSKALKAVFEAMNPARVQSWTYALLGAATAAGLAKVATIGLSGAVGAATKAMALFTKVGKKNPFIFIATVAALAAGAMMDYFGVWEDDPMDDAEKKFKKLNAAIEKDRKLAEELKKTQDDSAVSLEKQLKLLNAKTDTERMLINLGHEASPLEKKLIDQIVEKNAAIKAEEQAVKDAEKARKDAEKDRKDAEKDRADAMKQSEKDFKDAVKAVEEEMAARAEAYREEAVAQLQARDAHVDAVNERIRLENEFQDALAESDRHAKMLRAELSKPADMPKMVDLSEAPVREALDVQLGIITEHQQKIVEFERAAMQERFLLVSTGEMSQLEARKLYNERMKNFIAELAEKEKKAAAEKAMTFSEGLAMSISAIGAMTSAQSEQLNAQMRNMKAGDDYKNASRKKQKQLEDDMLKSQAKERNKIAKRERDMKVASATMNTYEAVSKAWAQGGVLGTVFAGIALVAGLAQVNAIMSTPLPKFATGGMIGGRRHSQGGTMIEAERGEFVMSRSAVDSIGIENLNRMNAGGGGGSVTVNVSGNVLSQDFVEGELAENIKEAIRRGTDFGIS